MAVKMTGAEWKEFYTDDDVWGGGWHEELMLRINGVPYAEDGDEYWTSLDGIDLEKIEDNAAVTLVGGTLCRDGDDDDRAVKSLLNEFRAWRKASGTITLAVAVPTEKLEDVKAAIYSAGGKVL